MKKYKKGTWIINRKAWRKCYILFKKIYWNVMWWKITLQDCKIVLRITNSYFNGIKISTYLLILNIAGFGPPNLFNIIFLYVWFPFVVNLPLDHWVKFFHSKQPLSGLKIWKDIHIARNQVLFWESKIYNKLLDNI